jgi:hypothetical protein
MHTDTDTFTVDFGFYSWRLDKTQNRTEQNNKKTHHITSLSAAPHHHHHHSSSSSNSTSGLSLLAREWLDEE